MILSRTELIGKLTAAGIPTGTVALFAPDEIEGALFGSLSCEYVQRIWDSFIATLQADPHANLTVRRDLGYGVTRIVPNWHAPGAVCRHWAFAFYGFALLCLAKKAIAEAQTNDGYSLAVVYYTATPRPEDLGRDGRHARIFHVDDEGKLCQFEEGDGDCEPMTPEELASITFMAFC